MERQAQGLALALGDKAPYFSLKGTDGRIYSNAEFAGRAGLCVVFTCNHCPYAQAYDGRLIALAHQFQSRGVQFVAICSNDAQGYPQDSFEQMQEKAAALDLPFPYLHDDTQNVAKAYDAQCTPEIYLFDGEQRLVYHGRIDDNHRDESLVESTDLKYAIEDLLAGKTPRIQLTPAIGCSIKWKR